eukprot:2599259-Prorocentrum_lima.AAC.1
MDGTIRIWDPVEGKNVDVFALSDSKPVRAVSWSPCNSRLASGSGDCKIQIWDLSLAGRIATLEGHRLPVLSIDWSLDGRHLASGSLDGTVR